MNTNIAKTLKALEGKLIADKDISLDELHKAYGLALKLRSQMLGVIYDTEDFGHEQDTNRLSDLLTDGITELGVVTLTICEPLPSLKEMTSAVQDHWLQLIHTAIRKAAHENKLPRFEKAFIWIEVITPRGTNNANLWDTSNRAINLIINNLKGIFFEDDNLEHMAFGVTGSWGESGITIVRVIPFDDTNIASSNASN